MSAIQPLPPDVVNLIAAGEVIDSIAAVVRELAENAIDAGATRLAIALVPDRGFIQVADNGQGMTLADLQQCVLPHCTSKIQTQPDIWRITSLGFRGEALHSIAQFGELTIRSRPANSAAPGWGLHYDRDGQVLRQETVAIAPGTIVTVTHLFASVPARRQALPPVATQLKAVQETVQQLALCHPHITWQVQIDTRLWLAILAGKTPRDLLPQFLPRLQVQDLGETAQTALANIPHTGLQLTLGLPDRAHRQRPDWVKVAINGRFVRSPQLEQTLIASMAHTLPRHRHPIAFLHLHLPPDCVDWHRHPAKTEVYLQNLEQWQNCVRGAIAHILRLNPPESAAQPSPRLQKLLKTAEPGAAYRLDRAITPAEAPEARPIPLKVVAQVNQTYIVAEHPNGLWLIEQHIAHERILYEQLQAAWEPVALPSPLVVGQLRDRQVQQLQQLGLDIESFGENLWAVRRLPGLLAEREDQVDAIVELSLCPDLDAAQVATACRSAIRNGTPLSLPEMQTLIDQWQQTRNPRTCPHGRPIYLAFDESALAKFFRRHWVIGKSHGI